MADTPSPPPSAATGLGVTGGAGGVALVLIWLLPILHLPPMNAETAIGALTCIAIIGHGVVKAIAGIASWAVAMREARACRVAKREEWTPEQRAAAKVTAAMPAGPPAAPEPQSVPVELVKP